LSGASRWTGRALIVICLIGILLTWCKPSHWILRSTGFFVPAYGPGLIVGILLCALGRSWKWLGIGVLGGIALLPLLTVGFIAAAHAPRTVEANLRILQANLYVKNDDAAPILDLIDDLAPTLLLFQEENEAWEKRLTPLKQQYHYHVVVPRYPEGGQALGIYSTLPIDEVELLAEKNIPAVSVRLHVGPETVRIINIHTASPWSPRRALRHDAEMVTLAAYLAALDEPLILAGDLNSTPWHRGYQDLLQQTGLLNARRGIAGTWPWFLPWIGVPLDHLLVSPWIPVMGSSVGPNIGSDHRPLITDLQIPGGGMPAGLMGKAAGEDLPPPSG
jgi:endonuclease/exonuclease/phosphatase (EEP) superfamily protein YafD